MKFDLIIANPPFQDTGRRGKTPHKLWIDFTIKTFERWLKQDGYLAQVSPSSFRSPNSKILEIMRKLDTLTIHLDSGKFFPGVGSSFAHYIIRNRPKPKDFRTLIVDGDKSAKIELSKKVIYLPILIDAESLAVHRKVMFADSPKLDVRWDYVTCHNILLRKSDTLSKSKTKRHRFPLLHTNAQIWWSSIQQAFALHKKVMWSRSGYTKPFYDNGKLGATDMAYYVLVENDSRGEHLTKVLNSKLFQYVFTTAKWSGFGNERVFRALPMIEKMDCESDNEIFNYFRLTRKERSHVVRSLG